MTANTEQSIRDAVAWAERQNVRIVLQSGADVQRVAGLLKQHDVPVILTSILRCRRARTISTPIRIRPPGVLAKAGVPFAFSSGGFQFSRDVPFQAGRAVAWGLSKDDAIRALTLDAARILGVDSQVGSIEAGKVANLVVISGDPLEDALADPARGDRGARRLARQLACRVVQEIHGPLRRPDQ